MVKGSDDKLKASPCFLVMVDTDMEIWFITRPHTFFWQEIGGHQEFTQQNWIKFGSAVKPCPVVRAFMNASCRFVFLHFKSYSISVSQITSPFSASEIEKEMKIRQDGKLWFCKFALRPLPIFTRLHFGSKLITSRLEIKNSAHSDSFGQKVSRSVTNSHLYSNQNVIRMGKSEVSGGGFVLLFPKIFR